MYCLYTSRPRLMVARLRSANVMPHRTSVPSGTCLGGAEWLRSSKLLPRSFICRHRSGLLSRLVSLVLLKFISVVVKMLNETNRYQNNEKPEDSGKSSLQSGRLSAVEELTLGLKQKLQLQARTRAAPYYIKKHEPVDLVERLLEERALVAEAVRRLQALQAQTSD